MRNKSSTLGGSNNDLLGSGRQESQKNVGVFTHTTSNWTGPCHAHDDRIQWVMPVKAGYRLSTSRSLEDIPVNSVAIIPPEQEHFHVTAEYPNVLLISLNRQVWNDVLSSWQEDGGKIPSMSGTQTNLCSETTNFMSSIRKTAQQGLIPGASLMLESLCMQLAISWLQTTSQQAPRFQHEQAIQKLCMQLRQNLNHPWTTVGMAQEVALSPSQLLRCFKEVTKTTPHRFLLGIRLDFALGQLSQTTKPIDVIAVECGFQSLRGLEMAVRSRYGVSPSQFRRESS